MVSQNVYCVGQVHEQQSAYDGVKGLLIDERARIALAEDDIAGIESVRRRSATAICAGSRSTPTTDPSTPTISAT